MSPDSPARPPEVAASSGNAGQGGSALSRAFILDAAITFIDRHGVAALTMRQLGAACGVEGMALYRYVHSRGELLTGVADHLTDRLYSDQLAARRQGDRWQDFLVRLAHGTRQIAVDHPRIFPLIASEPPQAPWLRPPLRSLRWLETFLDTLLSYGFDDASAVAAYRSYTTFLLGHLLVEASSRGAHLHPDEGLLDGSKQSELNSVEYPHLSRLHMMLSHDVSAAEFDESLETLLDRLELRLTPSN